MNEKITAQPPKEERQEVLKEIRQLENRKKILENKQRNAFLIALSYLPGAAELTANLPKSGDMP